jgi:hypothetical protein
MVSNSQSEKNEPFQEKDTSAAKSEIPPLKRATPAVKSEIPPLNLVNDFDEGSLVKSIKIRPSGLDKWGEELLPEGKSVAYQEAFKVKFPQHIKNSNWDVKIQTFYIKTFRYAEFVFQELDASVARLGKFTYSKELKNFVLQYDAGEIQAQKDGEKERSAENSKEAPKDEEPAWLRLTRSKLSATPVPKAEFEQIKGDYKKVMGSPNFDLPMEKWKPGDLKDEATIRGSATNPLLLRWDFEHPFQKVGQHTYFYAARYDDGTYEATTFIYKSDILRFDVYVSQPPDHKIRVQSFVYQKMP